MHSVKNKEGTDFYLHKMAGKNLYFYSSKKEGALQEVPDGYTHGMNPVTGLPYLKKK